MNINQAFPSKYLKAAEMDQDETYTIRDITEEQIGQGADADNKPVVYFNETDKGLALNKTNANTIALLYGPETDDWIGKPVTLFATEVDFQGKQTLAIRVRMRAPKAAPRQPAAAPAGPQSRTPPADAAKRAAWDAFKLTMPGQPNEVVANDWKAAVTAYLPGKDVTLWTVAEWQKFKADNFLPGKSPIGGDSVFQEADIPF